jgi:hypothetical protein
MKFTFTTREEYLTWRADWKARYFSTIKEIRTAALERREAERAFSRACRGLSDKPTAEESKERQMTANAQSSSRYKHRNLKAEATELLVERAESKLEAGRQRALRLVRAA